MHDDKLSENLRSFFDVKMLRPFSSRSFITNTEFASRVATNSYCSYFPVYVNASIKNHLVETEGYYPEWKERGLGYNGMKHFLSQKENSLLMQSRNP